MLKILTDLLPVGQALIGRDPGMPGDAGQAQAQLVLEAVHNREDDDQGSDAERHAYGGRQRDERGELVGALGPQIAQADVSDDGTPHPQPPGARKSVRCT